jgi:hypothetical protein
MPRETLSVDNRVKEVHQLKRLAPSDYETVRVEAYETSIFSTGVFQWDPARPAPTRDSAHVVSSVVPGYRPGDPNEGAWTILRSISPLDEGFVVAHPSSAVSRPFDPQAHDSVEASINAASTYVDANGGGVVLVPGSLSHDPSALVSVPSADVIVPQSRSRTQHGSDATSSGPGTYIINSSNQRVKFTLAEEDERSGLTVRIKRVGRFDVTVTTETSADVAGDASVVLGIDRMALDLEYHPTRNDWLIL